MMELITAILNKSKIEEVPVDVAYDMLAVDGDKDALKAAYEILDKYYVPITTLRRAGREAEITVIIKMAEDGADVENYIDELRKNNII